MCGSIVINKRQLCGKLVPRKLCNSCLKAKRAEKAKEQLLNISTRLKTDSAFASKVKKARKRTGAILRERYKKEGLPKAWLDWYRKFSYYGKSSIEEVVVNYLKTKNVNSIERHYPISNTLVDIYIPEKNLVIECQGDYWHMNPKKYKSMDKNKTTKRTAEQQWEKDRHRKFFIELQGYRLVEIWESEINDGDYSKLDIYL